MRNVWRRAFVMVAALLLALGARTMAAEPVTVMAHVWPNQPDRPYSTRVVAQLAAFHPQAEPRDAYGGLAASPVEPATGFFHTARDGATWWLVDPLGHRYLNIACCAVAIGNSPSMNALVPEKFGTRDGWRDATLRLLADLGFNGTAAWSDDPLLRTGSPRVAYTPIWNFMATYAKQTKRATSEPGHTGYPNQCILVFEPGFAEFCAQHAQRLAATKDDPWLLGHFTDNEMPFPSDCLDRFFALPATDPGRQAAEAWWHERHPDTPPPHTFSKQARQAWQGYVIDRYFDIVCAAIRKVDPNHMILGSRFYSSEKQCPEAFQAAGRHLDVVSVNLYEVWTPGPEIERWAEWSGKPIIITEWYAKGDDSGLANTSGAGWRVATQRERGMFYQNFTLGLLGTKGCVGWHWFKYADNDPANKNVDPSNTNSNKGLVNIRFEPYAPLTDQMRELNTHAYALRAYLQAGGR
jgi:hypothetical protein